MKLQEAPLQGHPSHGDTLEGPRWVLDALRSLFLAVKELLTQQLFGFSRLNKVWRELPGCGHSVERLWEWGPKRPKANPRGRLGVWSG